MTSYFSITVQVDGCDRSRTEAVREAVERQWDIECCVRSWDNPKDGMLRFVGKACLYAGEQPNNFASRLSEAVWQANGDYCKVELRANGVEGSIAGEGVYSVTPSDYWEWKQSGQLPRVRRIDAEWAQPAAA